MRESAALLGFDVDTGRPVEANPVHRTTHMHVVGAPGTGKSKLLESMIRGDILDGQGVCVVDPSGHLYGDLLRWIPDQRSLRKRNIILIDPSQDEWTVAFNPMKRGTTDVAYRVDTLLEACNKAWGGAGFDQTPRLKKCLRLIFTTLVERELSLADSHYFVSPNQVDVRKYLTHELANPMFREQWATYHAFKPAEYYEEFSSSINRLVEFLGPDRIRRMFCQTELTLDFRKVMDEGAVVLVNLSEGGTLARLQARTLGALIVADLWLAAQGREKGARPFYLYVDEFARYVTKDIGTMLDEGRKYGLHLILAHQHLAQLAEEDPYVYGSVMGSARTKVVFGGLQHDDAKIMAQNMFMGQLDPDAIKLILRRQAVAGYRRTRLKSRSESRGESSSFSESSTKSEGESAGEEGQGLRSQFASAYGESSSHSTSHTSTTGEQEALEPVLTQEVASVQYRSLDEQLYQAMAVMVNQPRQFALVKLPAEPARPVKVPDVADGYANPRRVGALQDRLNEQVPCIKPVVQVDEERRHAVMLVERQTQEFLASRSEDRVTVRKRGQRAAPALDTEPQEPFGE